MGELVSRLGRLRARDCMTRQVVTLGADYSLRDAAMVLRAATVSGAPVVDGEGRPVGMLSATDIVRYTQQTSARAEAEQHRSGGEVEGERAGSAVVQPDRPASPDNGQAGTETDWDLLQAAGFEVDQLPVSNVQEYMSRQVISVTEDATLLGVARILCQHHIHRVLVVDSEDRIKGIISSLDLLAAMVNAAEEAGLDP